MDLYPECSVREPIDAWAVLPGYVEERGDSLIWLETQVGSTRRDPEDQSIWIGKSDISSSQQWNPATPEKVDIITYFFQWEVTSVSKLANNWMFPFIDFF